MTRAGLRALRRFAATLLLLSFAATASAQLKALVGGTLIDGYGGPPLQNSVVLIDGQRITAVGVQGGLEIPAGADVIDTNGMTVLPGLWDMQTHLMRLGHGDLAHWDATYTALAERVVMPAAARQLLMAGVTSARDVGAPLDAAVAVRDRVGATRIPGPTLYVAGPVLEHSPPPGTGSYRWSLAGAADARAKAQRLIAAGVNYIVVGDIAALLPEELAAIMTEAHLKSLPVYGELRQAADIEPGLAAGLDGFLGLPADADPALPEAALAALRARLASNPLPVFWSPAISAVVNHEWLRQNAEPLDDPRWQQELPPIIVQDIRSSLVPFDRVTGYETAAQRRPTLGPKVRDIAAAGATLLIGSDAGVPAHVHPRATWQEIEAWVREAGIDPMTAIRAATYWPAVAMRVQNEVGTVSPGKYADIIAVNGDLLRHIDRLQDVSIVIKRGVRYR
jgi:imidazolonepropionase-like amidohydrolase